ncbi:hypothetical protein HAP48_0020265 [Bradyrhizobium septentrionale]|nr:hypothetical protein [Bradyrhizobium septentrionale]UGY19580.1 hypothetical protein HAP48_0020265 [Bradyrhizobium septentrionale]
MIASAKTIAKNTMPLNGTIEKAMPSLICPIAAERFMTLIEAIRPSIVMAVASDTPIMPTRRCRTIRPEAASQLWNTK